MKSSSFMQESNGIAELLFSANGFAAHRNRLFELREGESLTICSREADEHLYLFRGEVEVSTADTDIVLTSTSPRNR